MTNQSMKSTLLSNGVSLKNIGDHKGEEVINAEGIAEMASTTDTPQAKELHKAIQRNRLTIRSESMFLSENEITIQAVLAAFEQQGVSITPM